MKETKGAKEAKGTQYLSCADTAKLVRQALKEAFPGIKFGVRSKVYTGGASINVKWTDGPTVPMVEKVGHRFEGATFDPMTDCKSYHTKEFQGESVHFGANFVFFDRTASVELAQRALDRVWNKWRPGSTPQGVKPSIKSNPPGSIIEPDSDPYIAYAGEYLATLLYRELRTMPVGEYPGTSALADQVKSLTKVG